MAVLPLFFLGLWETVFGDRHKWPWLSLGAFLIYSSHILTTVMCAGLAMFLCVFRFVQIIREGRIPSLFKAMSLTIGLCVWHLLPMLMYMREGIGASSLLADVSWFSLDPAALFMWRFGDKSSLTETSMNGMPVEPGLVIWMGVFFLLYVFLMYGQLQKETMWILGTGAFCVLLTLRTFPWHTVAVLTKYKVNYLQFAWRLMTLGSFLLSMAAARGYRLLKPKMIEMPLIVLFLSILMLLPSVTEKAQNREVIELGEAIFPRHYYKEYTIPDTDMDRLKDREILAEGDLKINNYLKRGTTITAEIQNGDEETQLTFPLFAFSGYMAELNNEEITYTQGHNGCISLSIPANASGEIRIWFAGKKIWHLGDVVSICSVIMLVFAFYKGCMRNRKAVKMD